MAVVIDLKVDGAPTAPVTIGGQDVTTQLKALAASRQWDELAVPLRCFRDADLAKVSQPLAIRTAGALDLTISGVHLGSPPEGVADCR